MKKTFVCINLVFIVSVNILCQTPKNPNRLKFIVLPLVFYSPDTKLGGGLGGIVTFNFPKDSINARRSSVTIGAAYTQLNQFLLYFPFQLYPQNQNYLINGEVGYYRYVYNYFGTGNGFPDDYSEKYSATYPRLRLNVAKKYGSNLYLGVRYAFDKFTMTARDSGGLLIKNTITGSNGGLVSGAGLSMTYDTRNQIFYPTGGWLVDAQVYTEGGYTGSDFNYQRLSIDAARYIQTSKNTVLVVNAIGIVSLGDVPFHQLALLGGGKRLRGYYEGKYRDKDLFVLQSEWRFSIGRRFGGVVFGGMGGISDKISHFSIQNTKLNGGIGARFMLDKAQHINIRADYGIGYKSSGFYLTIGEAF